MDIFFFQLIIARKIIIFIKKILNELISIQIKLLLHLNSTDYIVSYILTVHNILQDICC